MILLVVAALWIVVLTPTLYKRWTERGAAGSIESFHRELRLLRRSGRRLAAIRPIETATSRNGLAPNQSGYPAVSSTPGRPSLVLLPPVTAVEEVAAMQGTQDVADAYVLSAPSVVRPAPGQDRRSKARDGGRSRGRARRRRLVVTLGAVCVATAVGGAPRSLHLLWALTAVSALALVCMVGLAVYAAELAADGRRGSARARRVVPSHGALRPGRFVEERHGRYRHDAGSALPFGYEPALFEAGVEPVGPVEGGGWDPFEDDDVTVLPRRAAGGR